MEKIMRKKGILMCICMSFTMGLTFSTIAKLRMGAPITVGSAISTMLSSAAIGLILGAIIPIKKLQDSTVSMLKVPEDNKILKLLVTSITSSLVFTPINCIPNMWFGMSMSLQDVPPDVVTIPQRMIFCAGLPHFVPAVISTIVMDVAIGTALGMLVSPLYNKLTNRICGI